MADDAPTSSMPRIASGITLRHAVYLAGQQLRAAGIDDATTDAALLLAHAIGSDRLTLISDADRRLSEGEAAAMAALVAARCRHMPVSRLLGRREFWSLDFAINDAVLDPRPDSETAVAAALAQLPTVDGRYRIADLGTGSGCLLLALLAERPRAWGVGLDLSFAAAQMARRNGADLGLSARAQFVVGNWGQGLKGSFDLIVANPPYIPTGDIAGLAREVRCHDPALALDGGEDGFAAYRSLAPDLLRLLKPSGQAIMECGHDQAAGVAAVLELAGLRCLGFHADLAGIDRCVRVAKV